MDIQEIANRYLSYFELGKYQTILKSLEVEE